MTDHDVLGAVERSLAEHFGQPPARAAVSFVGVEPIEVLRFEPVPGEWAYLSLGMSRRPMTGASESVVAADGPRAELMLHVLGTGRGHGEVWRHLAVLAASPVVEGVVYVEGMTVDLGQPLAPASRCTGGMIVASPVQPVPVGDDVVAVLQVLPATATELAWSRVHGSSALRERWTSAGTELRDLDRSAVPLD